MNEAMDSFFFLCGLGALLVIPLGILAAFMYHKTSKQPKNEFDAMRLECSLETLDLLKKYLKNHPEQRLGQALLNIGVLQDVQMKSDVLMPIVYRIDRNVIHEEPWDTLERVQKTMKKHGMD